MKKLIILFNLCLFLFFVKAQDPNFSQFFVSPLTLNPALTGKFDGLLRVAGNYRNQWPTVNNAFVTKTISADFPILKSKLSENDRWGIGVMAFSDRAAGGQLKSNFLSVSTAYHKSLDIDGFHILSAGFQLTASNKFLDGNLLNLEDELDLNGTWLKPSNDPVSNKTIGIRYYDLSVGLVYQGQLTESISLNTGISGYHLNKPSESFYKDGKYILPMRFTVHTGLQIQTYDQVYLHLNTLYSTQQSAKNLVIGGALEYLVEQGADKPMSIYLGSWIRVKDALIPYVGWEFNSIRLGASYDVNISNLKTASNYRGGLEISLVYIVDAPSSKSSYLRCPKF